MYAIAVMIMMMMTKSNTYHVRQNALLFRKATQGLIPFAAILAIGLELFRAKIAVERQNVVDHPLGRERLRG